MWDSRGHRDRPRIAQADRAMAVSSATRALPTGTLSLLGPSARRAVRAQRSHHPIVLGPASTIYVGAMPSLSVEDGRDAAPRCRSARSRSGPRGRLTLVAMMRSASRWVARSSDTLSGCRDFRAAGGSFGAAAHRSGATGRRCHPCVRRSRGRRGNAEHASDSLGVSTVTPRRVAMSNMLSAGPSGLPVRSGAESRRQRQAQIGGVSDTQDREIGQGSADVRTSTT